MLHRIFFVKLGRPGEMGKSTEQFGYQFEIEAFTEIALFYTTQEELDELLVVCLAVFLEEGFHLGVLLQFPVKQMI